LCSKIAANAETIVRREGDLDEQAGRVERRYRELAATIKPRIGVFSTAVALCRLYRLRGMQTDAAAL
jgi:hypothetical protein